MVRLSSVCIKVPSDSTASIDRRKIIKAFYEHDVEIVKLIRYVSQQFNNYTWVISFDESLHISELIGKTIRIDDEIFELFEVEDPNRFKTYVYRVLWLPHGFSKTRVQSYFGGNGRRVIDCIEETFQVDGIDDLFFSTGNFRVKVQFDVEKCSGPIKSGMASIDKQKVLITRLGEKPRCLKCNEEGHIRRNCPLNELKCEECGKNGHLKEKCSMATRLASQNEIDLPDEHDDEAEQIQYDKSDDTKNRREKRKDRSPLNGQTTKTSRNEERPTESSSDSEEAQEVDDEEEVEISKIQEEFNQQVRIDKKVGQTSSKSQSKNNRSSKLQQPKVKSNFKSK